jgi:uncharacterized Zn-binding protein involved in type VI secretion
MAYVIREGDKTEGAEGYNPKVAVLLGTSTGSISRVTVDGVGVVCIGDEFAPHTNSAGDTHTPKAGGSGGSKVFIGGRDPFTYGQPMLPGTCNDVMDPYGARSTVNIGV